MDGFDHTVLVVPRTKWRPHVWAHTCLSPHDCAQTRLCPDSFVPCPEALVMIATITPTVLAMHMRTNTGVFKSDLGIHVSMRIPKSCLSVRPSVAMSVRSPRKEISVFTLASSISVLH